MFFVLDTFPRGLNLQRILIVKGKFFSKGIYFLKKNSFFVASKKNILFQYDL